MTAEAEEKRELAAALAAAVAAPATRPPPLCLRLKLLLRVSRGEVGSAANGEAQQKGISLSLDLQRAGAHDVPTQSFRRSSGSGVGATIGGVVGAGGGVDDAVAQLALHSKSKSSPESTERTLTSQTTLSVGVASVGLDGTTVTPTLRPEA